MMRCVRVPIAGDKSLPRSKTTETRGIRKSAKFSINTPIDKEIVLPFECKRNKIKRFLWISIESAPVCVCVCVCVCVQESVS